MITNIWNKMYNLAREYYEEHGNLLLSKNYQVTKDGITYDLENWVSVQRSIYKDNCSYNVDQKIIKKLNAIGMVWDIALENKWNKMYELAQRYYEKHGNLLIPHDYKVKKDGNTYGLGIWISTQRESYKDDFSNNIDQEKINKLNEIGMVWNVITNKIISKSINNQYGYYQLGLLDPRNINEFLEDGIFRYNDADNIIKKGSSLILTGKKARINNVENK